MKTQKTVKMQELLQHLQYLNGEINKDRVDSIKTFLNTIHLGNIMFVAMGMCHQYGCDVEYDYTMYKSDGVSFKNGDFPKAEWLAVLRDKWGNPTDIISPEFGRESNSISRNKELNEHLKNMMHHTERYYVFDRIVMNTDSYKKDTALIEKAMEIAAIARKIDSFPKWTEEELKEEFSKFDMS